MSKKIKEGKRKQLTKKEVDKLREKAKMKGLSSVELVLKN